MLDQLQLLVCTESEGVVHRRNCEVAMTSDPSTVIRRTTVCSVSWYLPTATFCGLLLNATPHIRSNADEVVQCCSRHDPLACLSGPYVHRHSKGNIASQCSSRRHLSDRRGERKGNLPRPRQLHPGMALQTRLPRGSQSSLTIGVLLALHLATVRATAGEYSTHTLR